MADYQTVVDRVRAFVAGADQTRTDDLTELATAYAGECREANLRLRRCVDFLRRGLRSEAIHLADSQPNLLDMVGALDIPEIAEWEQLCATYDLARPMRMMVDAAQELNEAYAEEEPLQSLLQDHRLLALGRMPLKNRLEIIRELAAADPANPCWPEDQEIFENTRLPDLRVDVANAVRSQDMKVIDNLTSEILRQKWKIQLPSDIKDVLAKASWALHRDEAAEELNLMVPDARAARQAGSYIVAKQLLAKWERMATEYKLQPTKELQDEFDALKRWVTDHEALQALQESFQVACANLRAVLRANVAEEVLFPRFIAVQELGLPMPEDLERDYRAIRKKQGRTHRFEQIGIYAILALIVLIAIVSFAYVLLKSHTGNH
jgi:hypothetical protein